MKRFAVFVLATALTGYGAQAATPTPHYHGEKLAKKAALKIEDAEKTALATRPGEVTDRELEKEKGGSGLRYSFDIKSAGITYEVGIDAQTGKVLENSQEGKNPD